MCISLYRHMCRVKEFTRKRYILCGFIPMRAQKGDIFSNRKEVIRGCLGLGVGGMGTQGW
jgi:hypothetical protein